MTHLLAGTCYLAFVMLALMSSFLPLRHITPMVALAALSLAAGRLLEGPVHWQDKGIGYVLGMAILQIFVIMVGVGVGLRFLIAGGAVHLHKAIFPERRADVRIHHWLVLIAVGIVLGLVLAIGLAELFAGTSGGWYLDLGVALVAAGAAFAAIRWLTSFIATRVAALCLTLTLVAGIGSGQSGRIVWQAEAFAAGRPWCLVGPSGTPPITSTLQLGFFSLPKGSGYPHLALRLEGGKEHDEAHWSIRKQKIERGWGTGVLPCRPRSDYGTALRIGQLQPA